MRYYVVLGAAIFLAACQGSALERGDTLSGHWFNPDASLDASQSGVVFQPPCERAEFGPIVLDDHRAFAADSRVFTERGNIIQFPDDRLHIQGNVAGNRINVTFYVTRASGGSSDPVAMTLVLGKTQPVLVCVA
jgi:hypothetical protein